MIASTVQTSIAAVDRYRDRPAGIEAHLETRVQLGPFKDKRDADKALARARKLGVDAVLVSTH